MSEHDAIYTAGLVDGEGSVTLQRRNRGTNRYPAIEITSTSRELIDYLHLTWGGSVVIQKRYQEHHRQAWIWSVKYDQALRFLVLVAPHMKELRKKARAELLLQSYKASTSRNGKYTASQAAAKKLFEDSFFAL